MTTQYDVKSAFLAASGTLVPHTARLKGAVMYPASGASGTSVFRDLSTVAATYARSTTVATITQVAHNLSVGKVVYMDWDLSDGVYTVATVTSADVYTVTVTNSGAASGTVTVYPNILLQTDSSVVAPYTVVIPGEGILSRDGIDVILATNTKTTIFYG